VKVIDNFLTPEEQYNLLEYVADRKFAYRLYSSHIFTDDKFFLDRGFHAPVQFSHYLYMEGENNVSPHLNIALPLLKQLERIHGKITFFRCKVNLTTPYPPYNNYEPHIPHTDMKYDDGKKIPHLVCLYYINDCDGPTYFFNNEYKIIDMVQPAIGRAIIFDGSILHASSSPVLNPYRFIMNINFRQGLNEIP
jgi:hypothetical protein